MIANDGPTFDRYNIRLAEDLIHIASHGLSLTEANEWLDRARLVFGGALDPETHERMESCLISVMSARDMLQAVENAERRAREEFKSERS